MKLRTRVVLQLAALCFALAAPSFAADTAYLYVVNGIPGRDVGANFNPGFPIDASLNSECVVRGLTFDNISGPLSLAGGTYELQISEANSLTPCTNPAVLTSQVTIAAGNNVSAVSALSTSGQPTLLQFSDELSPVVAGNARFVFANTADASSLQATLTQVGVKNPKSYTVTAASDAQAAITVPAGTYLIQVVATGSTTVLATAEIALSNQSVSLNYVAGESANNFLTLINRAIRDVF